MTSLQDFPLSLCCTRMEGVEVEGVMDATLLPQRIRFSTPLCWRG